MRYIKKLSGRLCYLSPINVEDYQVYTQWVNDLETTRFLTLASMNIPFEKEREFLKGLSEEHTYAIIDQQTDKVIGNCGLVGWDPVHGTAEVGIFIGEEQFRQQGVGTEAMQLLCGYAFDYLNIHNLMLRVYGFNERAIRCYEKVGFKVIGTRRASLKRFSQRYDEIFMDCLPEDLIRIEQ